MFKLLRRNKHKLKRATITVVHTRPKQFPPDKYGNLNITFVKAYPMEYPNNLNIKEAMAKAFAEVHPDWPITEVVVSPID